MMKSLVEMENNIKQKLQSNYNNVRKAFLDLDKNHDCTVSAEELAKILKYGVKQQDNRNSDQELDFSLLDLLIKLRCKQDHTKMSYAKFC